MQHFLRLVSVLSLFLSVHADAFSQESGSLYPDSINGRVRYEIMIEMPKAYVSGVLIMHKPCEGCVNASIVNEFGISLMDFSYDEHKDKIRFHSLTGKLNKWYIRRTLGNDMKNVIKSMKSGTDEYINAKRKIKYTFRLCK